MVKMARFELKRPKKRQICLTFGEEPSKLFKKRPDDGGGRVRSSERWRRLRVCVLSQNPLCMVCGHLAQEVHHIVELAKDMSLAYEFSNLAPICEDCHKRIHSAYRRGIEPEMFFPKEKRLKKQDITII
jgi:hypothetical protein